MYLVTVFYFPWFITLIQRVVGGSDQIRKAFILNGRPHIFDSFLGISTFSTLQ